MLVQQRFGLSAGAGLWALKSSPHVGQAERRTSMVVSLGREVRDQARRCMAKKARNLDERKVRLNIHLVPDAVDVTLDALLNGPRHFADRLAFALSSF
jgi:hypothetical protein